MEHKQRDNCWPITVFLMRYRLLLLNKRTQLLEILCYIISCNIVSRDAPALHIKYFVSSLGENFYSDSERLRINWVEERLAFLRLHILYLFNVMYYRSVLEPIAKPSHTEANVSCKIVGKLRTTFIKKCDFFFLNSLTPNDPYRVRTAPLTSKRCILYIYSTNIGTEYFKHVIYSPFFSLQNAVCFIIVTYLVPVLFTFYKQGVLKFKKIPAPKV